MGKRKAVFGLFGLGNAGSDARRLSRREIAAVPRCHSSTATRYRRAGVMKTAVMRKIRREKKGAPIIARGLGLWVLMGRNNLAMRLF